ncbi:hypothetical protein PG987_004097 [Apiospora arundinis]
MPDQGGEFVQNSITSIFRKKAKISCHIEGCITDVADTTYQITQHITQHHPELLEQKEISEVIREWRREPTPLALRGLASKRDQGGEIDQNSITSLFRKKVKLVCLVEGCNTDIADTANQTPLALRGLASKRRGRGMRKNNAYWNHRSEESYLDLFKARDCLFADSNGKLVVPALADLDSGLGMSGPTDYLIMSPQYATQIGRSEQISTEFEDPGLHDVSGNPTPMRGIIKNVAFRLKGCSETFRYDFYVSDLLGNEGLAGKDIMFGAKFMQDHFASLFQNICAGATFVGNEIKSVFTQILNSGSSVKVKVQSLLDCVRSNAGKIFETSSNACSGSGSWAWWGAKKKKQDAREREEREKQEEAQRLHSARLEWGRRTQEAAAHGNNAGPHGQGPNDNSGSSHASNNPR